MWNRLKPAVPAVNDSKGSMTVMHANSLDKYWRDCWRTMTDEGYGGESHADLKLISDHAGDGFPFLRFEGFINMNVEKAMSLGVVGGCCACRGEIYGCNQLLEDYQGIEVVYRSASSMEIVLNMTMENLAPNDIFQVQNK